jgi:hypothetical protein
MFEIWDYHDKQFGGFLTLVKRGRFELEQLVNNEQLLELYWDLVLIPIENILS